MDWVYEMILLYLELISAYQIWGKVKVKDKDTITTKEIQKYYEQDRDILFCTKFPVIPAGRYTASFYPPMLGGAYLSSRDFP